MGVRTGWQAELGVLDVKVDDLSKRMHLRDSELANKLCQTIFELRV